MIRHRGAEEWLAEFDAAIRAYRAKVAAAEDPTTAAVSGSKDDALKEALDRLAALGITGGDARRYLERKPPRR